MKNKGTRGIAIFSGVFLFVGIVLSGAGIFISIAGQRFRERAEEITAVITDISAYRDSDGDLHHDVLVEYTVGGKLYEGVELNYYSSSMRDGQEITVLCDPDDPMHIQSEKGQIFLCVLLTGMGILFVVIGLIPIVVIRQKAVRKKKLRETGRRLYAAVEEIVQNTSYSVNGRHPYLIYCIYRDDYADKVYRFRSGNVWTDPASVLHPEDLIPVYVDERDYQHYYVDAESVLEGRIADYT